MEIAFEPCVECRSRTILEGEERVCTVCGMVQEMVKAEEPFKKRYTPHHDLPADDYIEELDGKRTVAYKKNKKRGPKPRPKLVDKHKLFKIKVEQHTKVDVAIVDICEKLGLNPEGALIKFENRIKKVKPNDLLKTNNLIANRAQLRGANVIACYFIWKVYRNQINYRQLRNVGRYGNRSFQTMLKTFH